MFSKREKFPDETNCNPPNCCIGFTKQSLAIGVNGFQKLYKQICAANAPKKAEFLKRTQWIKKDDVDDMYTCAAMASKNYIYINEKVDNDDQIQQGKWRLQVVKL